MNNIIVEYIIYFLEYENNYYLNTNLNVKKNFFPYFLVMLFKTTRKCGCMRVRGLRTFICLR